MQVVSEMTLLMEYTGKPHAACFGFYDHTVTTTPPMLDFILYSLQ